MPKRIPSDPQLRTSCSTYIKSKITKLENAAIEYAFKGTQPPEHYEEIIIEAQQSRYDLERAILDEIDKAVKSALINEKKKKKKKNSRRPSVYFME